MFGGGDRGVQSPELERKMKSNFAARGQRITQWLSRHSETVIGVRTTHCKSQLSACVIAHM